MILQLAKIEYSDHVRNILTDHPQNIAEALENAWGRVLIPKPPAAVPPQQSQDQTPAAQNPQPAIAVPPQQSQDQTPAPQNPQPAVAVPPQQSQDQTPAAQTPQPKRLDSRQRFKSLWLEKGIKKNECSFDWEHLIYAFMLENTRMAQIFQKVILAYRTGETLGAIDQDIQLWLRNTEMLFFRHLPGFYTYSLRSEIRPDIEATRRNAYYRMFGIDLGHGDLNNKSYPYLKPAHANTGFTKNVTLLLEEVHQAIINLKNTSGTNSTDFASIATLSTSLKNMLVERRRGGNLSQEEFNAVAMMSWFHFTLDQGDFSLFKNLGAEANSPEDRLIKIGHKVGLPANTKSGSLIELAHDLSDWLLMVEEGFFDSPSDVGVALASSDFRDMMTNIITHWANATGAQIKRPGVAVLN